MSTALLDRHAPAGTLFRLATAGSVDDGKSTLCLLYTSPSPRD